MNNDNIDHMITLKLDKYSTFRIAKINGKYLVMGDICIMSSNILGSFENLSMANLFKLAILDHKMNILETKIRNKQNKG